MNRIISVFLYFLVVVAVTLLLQYVSLASADGDKVNRSTAVTSAHTLNYAAALAGKHVYICGDSLSRRFAFTLRAVCAAGGQRNNSEAMGHDLVGRHPRRHGNTTFVMRSKAAAAADLQISWFWAPQARDFGSQCSANLPRGGDASLPCVLILEYGLHDVQFGKSEADWKSTWLENVPLLSHAVKTCSTYWMLHPRTMRDVNSEVGSFNEWAQAVLLPQVIADSNGDVVTLVDLWTPTQGRNTEAFHEGLDHYSPPMRLLFVDIWASRLLGVEPEMLPDFNASGLPA